MLPIFLVGCRSRQAASEYGTALSHRSPFPRASCSKVEMPAALRPALTIAAANALVAAPAFAEAGKIFDFNLTLPVMAAQFMVLMVVMDALVYRPVGKVLDERDADLRTKVEAVKDNSATLAKYTVRPAASA